MGPRWHVRVAARTGVKPRIGGGASPTPDRELSGMGGPGPHAYRGGHGHLRPVSRRADPAVPPRPVVAAGLEPGPVPGRGHPGAALRAAHRGAPVVVVHHPVMGRFPWAPELGEGVAGTAAPPDDRVPRGAGVHRDPAAPAARHGRGGGNAAAAAPPLLPLHLLMIVFLAVPVFTGIQRHRLRATAGVLIPPQPVIPHRLSATGIVAMARARATWRQLVYHLLAGPALAAAPSPCSGCGWRESFTPWGTATRGPVPRGPCSGAASPRRSPGPCRPSPISRWTPT